MSKISTKHPIRRSVRLNDRRFFRRFRNKKEADLWVAQMLDRKERARIGLESDLRPERFDEFVSRWMANRKLTYPLSSIVVEEARLRLYILPAFGTRMMHEIRTYEIREFLDHCVATGRIGTTTRNRMRGQLHKMYADALRDEIVTRNPVTAVNRHREKEAWDFWCSNEEIERYLLEADRENLLFGLFALIALNTGLRVGEILGLQWNAIWFERGLIRVCRIYEKISHTIQERTKGRKERHLGMNTALYDALLNHKKSSPYSSLDNQVLCRADGSPMADRFLHDLHKRVCKRAGVKRIRLHDLRRTFASHFVMNGGKLTELQFVLGHTSPMMTLKNAHFSPDALKGSAEVVCFGKEKEEMNCPKVVCLAQYRK